MIASICLLLGSVLMTDSKVLATQICLDRLGYSCNTIDGQWGRKSERALRRYLTDRGLAAVPLPDPETAYDRYFAESRDLFEIVEVTADDLAALVKIPSDPAARSQLPRMGYESILEMFAERGHTSQRTIERLNPGVDWRHPITGLKLVVPKFFPISEYLNAWPRRRKAGMQKLPEAVLVKVSLGNFEITAYDDSGRLIALFPCSIARNKSKLPPHGEQKIVTTIARPNYTYTPDYTPPGKRVARHVWPEGPNCPIGVAWLGLSLPGYGIHGTPHPESIGRAESHGCFRLSNWNAARLYSLCKAGTKVVIEQ